MRPNRVHRMKAVRNIKRKPVSTYETAMFQFKVSGLSQKDRQARSSQYSARLSRRRCNKTYGRLAGTKCCPCLRFAGRECFAELKSVAVESSRAMSDSCNPRGGNDDLRGKRVTRASEVQSSHTLTENAQDRRSTDKVVAMDIAHYGSRLLSSQPPSSTQIHRFHL